MNRTSSSNNIMIIINSSNTMEELSEYMESAGEPVEIQFHENTSNAGKKFYTLEIM